MHDMSGRADVEPRTLSEARGPVVSVVVPSHNRAFLLPLVLRSLLAQRFVSLEVIVVDDGSQDETSALLECLSAGDDRLRAVRHATARGVSEARNSGIRVARGQWIAFCDDDDLWAPTKLLLQLEAMGRTGSVWACTGTVNVDSQWQIIGGERLETDLDVCRELRDRDVIPGGGSTVIADSDLVRSTGDFDATINGVEDWEYWLRLARSGPPAIVDRPLVAYRVAGGSISHAARRMADLQRMVRRRLDEELAQLSAGPEARTPERYSATMHEMAYLADRALRGGDRRLAARLYATMAFRGEPIRSMAALMAIATPEHLARRHDRFVLASLPAGWVAEADGWLTELLRGESSRRATTPAVLISDGAAL